jgi:hypothetical protein
LIALVVALSVSGVLALPAHATFPYPGPGSNDPYDYQDYAKTGTLPPDMDDGERWKYSSKTACQLYGPDIPSQTPPEGRKSLNCDPVVEQNPLELRGVTGASLDEAWKMTTGRPDVIIAVHDSGIEWDNRGAMVNLVTKTWLNRGELPLPQSETFSSDPRAYDVNSDGVFNIVDYCTSWKTGGGCQDARVTDLNHTGLIDPEDLIFRFSDGIDQDNNGYRDDFVGWDAYEDDNDPFDEVGYGHGTGEAGDSTAEAQNGQGGVGSCPNCMVMHMRVGDSFIADTNNFAEGEVYAVDNGATVIQSALGTLNNSRFAQEAIDYAWRRGVAFIASAADEQAGHHNQPSVLEHAITMNSLGEPENEDSGATRPASYLEFRGCTNYGAYITASVPSNSCSSEAVGRSAGMTALLYAAARNNLALAANDPACDLPATPLTPAYCSFKDYGDLDDVDLAQGDVRHGWGLSAEEVDQLIATTADDIDFKPPAYTAKSFPPESERFPATDGWDPFFGYGRINARRMVAAVVNNKVPPEADISSPKWFDIHDPSSAIQVDGYVASRRTPKCTFEVQWAVWNWRDANLPADFKSTDRNLTNGGNCSAPIRGRLATIDSAAVKAELDTLNIPAYGGPDGPAVDPATGRGDQQNRQIPDKWGVILRVVVTARDASGAAIQTTYSGDKADGDPRADTGAGPLVGLGTKEIYLRDDPMLFAGFPIDLHGDGAASPRFADIDDDGTDEMIVATSNGEIHAYEHDLDASGSPKEVPGWPVRTADYDLHYSAPGYTSGEITTPVHAAVLRSPVVADLDRDGDLEVAAGDFQGNLSIWDRSGRLISRVRSNPMFSTPQRPDREQPQGEAFYDEHPALVPSGLPNDPDLVPDLVNRHDKLNRLIWWFMAPPSAGNIDGDDELEILIGSADRHLYAFNLNGTPVPGWPVLLRDPAKTAHVDPLTHEVENKPGAGDLYGTKIVTAPALGDTNNDGVLEVFAAVNEEYPAGTEDSPETDEVEEPINTDDPVFQGLCDDPPDVPVQPDPEDPTGGSTDADPLISCAHQRVYAIFVKGSLAGNGPGDPANGHPNANAFLEGWPVRLADAQAELLPVVGSGPDGSPIIGNVNDTAALEIGIFSTAGPGYILKRNGKSIYGQTADGRDRTLLINAVGPNTNSEDSPSIPAVGGAIFSDLGPGKLSFVAPAAGLGKLLDVVLPEDQLTSDNHLSIWELTQASEDQPAHRSQLPSYPREVNDLQFLTTPSSFDVNGDDLQEVLEGTAYNDLHAFNLAGDEPGMRAMDPAGWPKFTGGWSVSPAVAGDFDGDGTRDIAAAIREGRLFVWESNGASACAPATWPDFGHDQWSTNNVHTDAIRPRVITDLRRVALDPDGRRATIAWTAPGDDGRCNLAHSYEIRRSTHPLSSDDFSTGSLVGSQPAHTPGSTETLPVVRQCEPTYVAVRTWDANDEADTAAHPANPSAVNAELSNVLIPGSTVGACSTASPSTGTTSPATRSPSITPTGTRTPTASPSGTTSPTATPSGPGSASPTIGTSKAKPTHGETVTLGGRVTATAPCSGPYHIIVEQRMHGTEEFKLFAETFTDEGDLWKVGMKVARNAAYRASVEPKPNCQGETSAPVDVLVRVRIDARRPQRCRAAIHGRVRPAYPGTKVILQRRADKRWHDVAEDVLSARSRFGLRPTRCRSVYRVIWRKQSEKNIWGKSRALRHS